MKPKHHIIFISKLNQALKNKDSFFDYNYTINIGLLSSFLKEEKLISNFVVFKKLDKIYIRVFLLIFLQKSIFHSFCLKTTSKTIKSKKLFELNSIVKNRKNVFSPIFVINTTAGLLTHMQAISKKLGGILVGIIYI